jgi:hypothetical protein
MFSRVTCVRRVATIGAMAIAVAGSACINGSKLVLNQEAEAHRLASHLHVQFTRGADASNRAVMADTDEASQAAAREAGQAAEVVDKDTTALRKILDELGDRDELQQLDAFATRYAQYRALDADILPLAVENTNIKAQRLSFGPAQDAVDTLRHSIDAAARTAPQQSASQAAALAARTIAAVREVQVLEARHIAESDEEAMTRIESAMKASTEEARRSLQSLKGMLPATSAASVAAAADALDRLTSTNAELVTLSRRNSNVRSLALSLGKKRTVTAECEESLQALEDGLARHHFTATR